jgi:cyanophycinase
MGYLLLAGGAEFGGLMSEPDLRALELAGGPQAPIAVLPAAAAPDNNHERAGRNSLRWFRSLGATSLDLVPIIDKRSAADPALAERIRRARLIYILGGFPRYLCETLAGSPAWQAAQQAYAEGAVIAGSSAGAMVLCEHYYDPDGDILLPGLGLIARACVLPHHNRSGRTWAKRVRSLAPEVTLIGIDERTGMIDDARGTWTAWGAGQVTLYHRGGAHEIHARGESFGL